jgi:hypothetical protein
VGGARAPGPPQAEKSRGSKMWLPGHTEHLYSEHLYSEHLYSVAARSGG